MLKRLALSRVLLTVLLFFVAVPVEAKDLRQRLGIGMKSNNSIALPEVAVVYHPSNELAVTGGLGINTAKDNSRLVLDVGVRRNIFYEDHMNFYMGGHLGMINNEVATVKSNGWELTAVFGTEFFFAGLDNLAFTFEAGVGVLSTDSVQFRTIADSPLAAGVIFYF